MKRKKLVHEGTTKNIYATDDDEQLLMAFSDSSWPLDAKQPITIQGRGSVANKISALLFEYLQSFHVPTHFVKVVSDTEMLIQKLDMVPIRIMVHNMATGSLRKRFGLEEGRQLDIPIVEYYLKDQSLGNPIISASHAVSFRLASSEELRTIDRLTTKINAVLKSFFERRQLRLVNFQMEFGRVADRLAVGNDLAPEALCIWESTADGVFDKTTLAIDTNHAEEAIKHFKQRLLTS